MFKPSKSQLDSAAKTVGSTLPMPAGYRIAIKPLPGTSSLKAGEAEKFRDLADIGFVSQSKKQTEREERGQHTGILCHVGGGAFKGSYSCGDSPPVEGDVVVFNKYAGLYQEFPPGSGDIYHFCNDEDIIGVYELNVLVES